jgi:hypothetical protein
VETSALIVSDVATCPLCSAAFDGGEPYRDHLEEAHGLEDDEGTATVTQIHARRIEDEAAMSLVAEAVLDAPAPAAASVPASASGSPPAEPTPNSARNSSDTEDFRAEFGRGAATRYLLATRHGDVALYAPGVLMLLIALVRLDADVLGFLLLLLGTALVVLGMLLPLVLGRR